MGKISNILSKHSQAFNYYQKALAIFDRFEGLNNIYSLKCMISMAQAKHTLKEYNLSLDIYEKALSSYIYKFGNNNTFVYIIYMNVIYLAHLLKNTEKKVFYCSQLLEKCCEKVKNP